jgi:hypothetical protein
VDWNNDNKKDLVIGDSVGLMHLLINTGTDANPEFANYVFLKDGGSNLNAGGTASPTVVDWNLDGKKDLIIGVDMGDLHFFQNQGTDASPVFNGSVLLAAGGSTIDVGFFSRPSPIDWDEDGVLDLLVGNSEGYVTLFQGLGPLSLSDNMIKESIGGVITMNLDAGVANANRNYIMVGSISGTSPGIPLPGGTTVLPVNWDIFTSIVLDNLNTLLFNNFLGVLSATGTATAQLNVPGPVPGAAGLTMSFAYALSGPWDFASNGANVEIVP